MRERRGAMQAAAVLGMAAVLLVGACTNADSEGSGSEGGTGSTGDTAAAGTSPGVTADTIKIGWPMLDQQALVDAGLATDFGDLVGLGQKIVDDWNADGGINGREVELVNRTFGTDIATMLTDMQRVCLELTEDEKVFATVAPSWFGDAVTCLAGDHSTPLVVQTSMAQTVMDSGKGNIFLANFVWEDALRSAVRAVDDSGDLATFEKIGVFAPLEPGMRKAIDDGLAPALEDAGTEIVRGRDDPLLGRHPTPPPSPPSSAGSRRTRSTPSSRSGTSSSTVPS